MEGGIGEPYTWQNTKPVKGHERQEVVEGIDRRYSEGTWHIEEYF